MIIDITADTGSNLVPFIKDLLIYDFIFKCTILLVAGWLIGNSIFKR